MKLPRALARIVALIALLQPALLSAVVARPPAERPGGHAAHPALWRLTKGPSTIYLFGTIHALPPHFEWETPEIRTVLGSADRLVLEAVIDSDPNKSATALLRLGLSPTPLPPLEQRVAPKYRASLANMAAKTAVPIETLNSMKTWAAGMVLFGTTVSALGVSSADGVEEQLKAQFRSTGKPVEGLETLDQQLGFFDTLDETQQRDFLQSVVDQHSDDAADFGKMLGAWSHGNEKGIAISFDKDMKKSDALRDVLIARRNAHWADAIVARLAVPGTQFVAVGAGHLVGRDSVQAKLAKLGYKAERVE
jgi:uncharacterized protein YbaP (TraB family)